MTKLLILFAVLLLGSTLMMGIDYALGIHLPIGRASVVYKVAYMLWGAALFGIMNFFDLYP